MLFIRQRQVVIIVIIIKLVISNLPLKIAYFDFERKYLKIVQQNAHNRVRIVVSVLQDDNRQSDHWSLSTSSGSVPIIAASVIGQAPELQ